MRIAHPAALGSRALIALSMLLAVALALVAAFPAWAQEATATPDGRDPAFEQEVVERLSRIAPSAVRAFQEATAAYDAGDYQAAKAGFERVLELAPDFPDALRRLSYAEGDLGNVDVALQRAQQAVDVAPAAPANHQALARALYLTQDEANYPKMLTHAQAAADGMPGDLDAHSLLLAAGALNGDVDAVRQAVGVLIEVTPDDPLARYYAGLVAATDGEMERAERELLLSRSLGMDAETVQEVLDDGITAGARTERWLRRGRNAVIAWAIGFLVLFGLGALLSKLTLAAVKSGRPTTTFQIGPGERLVRGLYRVVIVLTSVYFYISIPFVILAILAVAAGVFYVFNEIGSIPVRLAGYVLVFVVISLLVTVRSLFARRGHDAPGRPLPQEEAPQLWTLATEVADKLETRPIQAIYITPDSDVAVTERGRLWSKLRGTAERTLILGLGALGSVDRGQLRAILAHEYGHFSNRDTAGGSLAGQVHLSLYAMAYNLAANGQARWYNPAYIFVYLYQRVFSRITLGASRLQEILADRFAVMVYGVPPLRQGLLSLTRQDLVFDAQVRHEVELARSLRRGLQNLYTLPPVEGEQQVTEIERRLAESLERPTSPYDSHPAYKDRMDLLAKLEGIAPEAIEDPAPAWDLLPNAEALQAEMTALVQKNIGGI